MEMIKIENTTLEVARLSSVLKHFFEEADFKPKHFEGVYLAGGAISSIFAELEVNDLDFYCESEAVKEEFLLTLTNTYGYSVVCTTANAITLERKVFGEQSKIVQVIVLFMGDPECILNTFDFTCVQALYDFTGKQFLASSKFLRDVAARRLVYSNTSPYPICALYRTQKYIDRGYKLPGATIVAISLAIHKLRLDCYADLSAQLQGIDTAMFLEIVNGFDLNKKFELDEFLGDWMSKFEQEDRTCIL